MRVSSSIQRRLLVNYRLEPDVAARLLPQGLRPQLVSGWAVAGVCLIRLGDVRPYGFPAAVGVTTENAAHRIAVEWAGPGGTETGVFLPRRDSSSWLTSRLGGRVFPGVHQRAQFRCESADRVRVRYAALDRQVSVDAEVVLVGNLNGSRLFDDVGQASAFFCAAPVALSPGRDRRLEAVRLATDAWAIEPAELVRVRSSYFDDRTRFPAGTVELDSALLMRDVPVTWSATRAGTAARTAGCRRAVVVRLARRVDAQHGPELVGRRAVHRDLCAAASSSATPAGDREGLLAGEAEGVGRSRRRRTAAAGRPCRPGWSGGCARSSRR